MATKATNDTYDAIVIGAGPAGGTAALMLAKAGWSVAIVEKRPFPRRKVCGEYISATSLPLLWELGLGETILRLAGPEVRRAGLFAGETQLTFSMPKVADAVGGCWGRAVGREHLDLLLLEAAARAGAALWQPWSATGLERCGGGWVCHIAAQKDCRAIAAPLVIAASGSWERGPVPVGRIGSHRSSDLLAFKGHFIDCDLPGDLMPLLAFPGGYGGMVHSDGGRVSLSCCIRRDMLDECRRQGQPRAADAVLQHIQRSCAGVRQAMSCARLDRSWLAAGPINPGMRKPNADGLFLVGNLAGEAHPIVAEGISIAIQSAWLLCRRLIARQEEVTTGRAIAETGEDYAAEWRKRFAGRIRAAAWFAYLAMQPGAVTALLPMLARFPGLLTFGAELSGKTKQLDAVS